MRILCRGVIYDYCCEKRCILWVRCTPHINLYKSFKRTLSSTYIVVCNPMWCTAYKMHMFTHTHTRTHEIYHMKKNARTRTLAHNAHNVKHSKILCARFASQIQFRFSIHKHKLQGIAEYCNR